ncbi:MAG: HIT family protein, partial [Nanoarchaeota archaeon]
MECDSCTSIIENKNLIFETKYWKISLADNQYYLGRCIVGLKRHASSLSGLDAEEITNFLEVVKKLEYSLKKSFNATMFNWSCLMNHVYKDKKPNPHVHFHF